jgi:hypothetical protein
MGPGHRDEWTFPQNPKAEARFRRRFFPIAVGVHLIQHTADVNVFAAESGNRQHIANMTNVVAVRRKFDQRNGLGSFGSIGGDMYYGRVMKDLRVDGEIQQRKSLEQIFEIARRDVHGYGE